jgi:PIN domain nuclease of toxin-antitoxin system
MKYLLDTHTLLWAITEKSELSHTVIRILEDTSNEILVSAVNLWEVSQKFSLGKLNITGFLPQDLPRLAVQSGFTLIPLMPVDAISYHQLVSYEGHKDPFDKMLIWQAIQQSLILISEDKHLAQYAAAGLKVIW